MEGVRTPYDGGPPWSVTRSNRFWVGPIVMGCFTGLPPGTAGPTPSDDGDTFATGSFMVELLCTLSFHLWAALHSELSSWRVL